MHKRLVGAIFFAVLLVCGTVAEAADRKFPDKIDPAKRYMFYMHGTYVERQGPFEKYAYYEILESIEKQGFVVIGEARSLTNAGHYAKLLAKQVQQLLDEGVPSYHITVAGHSKGGMITMNVAAKLGQTGVNYVVFAGCGLPGKEYLRGYSKFVENEAHEIDGKFLIAWASDDEFAGNCDAAMKKGKADFDNKILPAGLGGHKIFYSPNPVWMNELITFAKGG